MSDELILSLIQNIKDGDEISLLSLRDELKGFIYSLKPYFLLEEDAYDYSLVPLREAALKYDPSRGVKFTTFLSKYLSSAFINEGENRYSIKLPEKIKRLSGSVYSFINEYKQDYEEEPSLEEIQEGLMDKGIDVSIEDIEICLNLDKVKESVSIDDEEVNYGSHLSSSMDDISSLAIDDIAKIIELTKDEKEWFETYYINKSFTLREIATFEKMKYHEVQSRNNIIRSKIQKYRKALIKNGYGYLVDWR